jgi:trans-2,3-dihydro-3-hydroxyanthranilate isomerase
MQQRDPVFGSLHDVAEISRVTGFPSAEIDCSTPIQTVSTGLPFCIVRLRTLAALECLEIPQVAAKAYLAASDAKFFYVFAPVKAASGAAFQGRMQFYGGEDPATGSASGCAIAYMVRYGLVASGHEIVLEQGIQIGRPSRIVVSANLTDRGVTQVFVGGRTIPVASGQFSLPWHGSFPQRFVIKPQQ